MFSYPIAARWVADAKGRVVDVGFLQLAADPRHEIQPDILQSISVHNKLACLDGSKIPTISVVGHEKSNEPMDEVKLGGPLG